MTSAVRGVLQTLLLIAALLAGGEVIARRVAPLPTPIPEHLRPGELERGAFCEWADADVLWTASVNTLTGGETLDALGLRPPTGDDPTGEAIRILILGDSNAFGLGVAAEQTYAARLQLFFDRAFGRGAFAIRNGAVPGFTVAQALRWFETRLSAWRPDLVVVAVGNGSELDPAFDHRSDLELLDAARRRKAAHPLRTVDAVLGAFRDTDDAAHFGAARVRVSATQFFETLSNLVGAVRSAGGEPMLLAPTVPVGRPGQDSRDASLALYRECVRRVAGASGTGFVDAGRELGADPHAFCVLSPRLTSRGHARVASKLAFALLQDRAVAERVRRRAEAAPHETIAFGRTTALAALSQLAHDGPVGVDAASVRAPFDEWAADVQGTPGFELLRAMLDLPLNAKSSARFDSLVRIESPLPMHEFSALRALLAGESDKAAVLLQSQPRDPTLHAFIGAISRLGTAPVEAAMTLQTVIEDSPGNGLPLLFAAKAALSAGDPRRATVFVQAGFDAVIKDGHDGLSVKDLGPPKDDSDAAAAAFLSHESVLFAGDKRETFARMFYWSWVCEPLLRDDGHALVRRSARLQAAGFAVNAATAMTAAIAWAGTDAERNAALGLDLLTHGLDDEAEKALDRSLAAEDSAAARYLRALVALDAQDYTAALDHLDHAVAADAGDGRLHLARGRCLLKLGRNQEAAAAFERTLEIWPGSEETIQLLEKARANSP